MAALACIGCGADKSLVAVTGKVLVQGKPAVGAYVQFHPEGPTDANMPRPSGLVGANVFADCNAFA